MKLLLNKDKDFLSEFLVSEVHLQVNSDNLRLLPDITPYYVIKLDNVNLSCGVHSEYNSENITHVTSNYNKNIIQKIRGKIILK